MRFRSFLRGALLVPVSGVVWLATAACGPSFQAVYEGNARFEHCYAIEENATVSMPEKAACWREWSERYTYGQTRDRVQYATARYVALSEAREAPTDEALMMAAPGQTPRTSVITAPAPTNAFAPPPKILEQEQPPSSNRVLGDAGGPPVDAGPPPRVVAYPSASCVDGCQMTFKACGEPCAADAGAPSVCKACPKQYKECMRGCFK